ncbi:putative pentatricopeptide repeat-containing protein At5g37570 [Cynara cardunculus var. scolymus]|uniref:putative pentatricopeptide repeat-containing protein At5g37570 n=1 Tax=Cynara cardunculus var. scolymus TaxID=59895 RepID=UPI000D6273B2|nr:putative pentatricopeptide repeat-containing protein At5g37570 [Cynara cardunculus var. scolymus]XP_024983748.1 putative pentatricopeptide repeat-containing protein At5g37570 [Cynara cardunculus var. scolymus]XP_024983755.1 putative pentatricopeptide repeat-containing protein At5g37570 [Cynara cardunculus var. scolymus]
MILISPCSTLTTELLSSSSLAFSTLSLLKACKNVRNLEQVHAQIIRKGSEQDHFLITQFISACNSVSPNNLSYAQTVFDRVLHPGVYLWNTLIKCHCTHSSLATTIKFFRRMKQSYYVAADKYTFPLLVKACSCALASREGQVLHGLIIKYGTEADVFVGSSLIDLYGKCQEIANARKVFDRMPVRNVVTWTSMIVGYSTNGDCLLAKKLFDAMPQKNHASWNAMINGFIKSGDLLTAKLLFDEMPCKNTASFTTMINGYAKSGDMASARSLFDQSPEKDIVTWSAMIAGYAQNGQPKEAIKIFTDMRSRNVKPDEYVMVSLMSACSQAGDWELAKWVDSYMSESSIDRSQNHVAAALVDMNAKCGNLERAATLFEKMSRRDLISYSSMIQGLSVHGHGVQAVALFHRMLQEGLTPDDVAFTVILSACSHADLVEEGCRLFDSMINEYSLTPSADHYACKVNLLGRAGRVREAYDILIGMPVEPNASAWGALLWACRIHGDVSLGKEVAARLFKIEPQNAANYVLLSDMYAASDQWSDVNHVRKQMTEMGIRKLRGCSWI